MKTFGLMLFLVLPALTDAQVVTAPANTPLLNSKGSFFALSVADIEASTSWYRTSSVSPSS